MSPGALEGQNCSGSGGSSSLCVSWGKELELGSCGSGWKSCFREGTEISRVVLFCGHGDDLELPVPRSLGVGGGGSPLESP